VNDSVFAFNTQVAAAAVGLLGAGCGLVGVFTLLRRRALVGDVVAHSALPGLCIAFLVVGTRSLPALLLGAFFTGVLGVATAAFLARKTRLKEDAILGAVLSVYFGFGAVLDSLIQSNFRNASQSGLDSLLLGKTAGILLQDVVLIGIGSAGCLAIVLLLYKEWRLLTFDPSFGAAIGFPIARLELLLLAMAAAMVVIGLPAVGVVMMAALLILPAAAARFWTNRLEVMTTLAAVFGGGVGLVGVILSAIFDDLPAGPTIVLLGAGVFVISMLAAPERGLIAVQRRQSESEEMLRRQVLLVRLFESANPAARTEPVDLRNAPKVAFWPSDEMEQVLDDCRRLGLVTTPQPGFAALTEHGATEAERLHSAERLWNTLLDERPESASVHAVFNLAEWESELDPEHRRELQVKAARGESTK
jgi:manganese/zinc/iron transport system permease protein